jgi:hypothetical protein
VAIEVPVSDNPPRDRHQLTTLILAIAPGHDLHVSPNVGAVVDAITPKTVPSGRRKRSAGAMNCVPSWTTSGTGATFGAGAVIELGAGIAEDS